MGSELSGIFQVKLVAKNIVSLGTQDKAASAVSCLFLKKHTNVLQFDLFQRKVIFST